MTRRPRLYRLSARIAGGLLRGLAPDGWVRRLPGLAGGSRVEGC